MNIHDSSTPPNFSACAREFTSQKNKVTGNVRHADYHQPADKPLHICFLFAEFRVVLDYNQANRTCFCGSGTFRLLR